MPGAPPASGRSWKSTACICCALFAVSAALRVIFLIEYRSSPTFSTPIIDSASYDRIARMMAGGRGLDPEFFWHGSLYPAMLSLFYALSAGSVVFARFAQAILAGLTAVTVFFLGRRLFDTRTGILAGMITALYGPLIFYDTEILATGTATLLAPLIIILSLKAKGEVNPLRYLIYGICAGIAVLARATFLPYVIMTSVLLAFALRAKWLPWKSIAARESLITLGMLAILIPVAVASGMTTGHFSPLPRSGSINLYIGNNPDTERTMMIRPGAEWRELLARPVLDGENTEKAYRRYFTDRTVEYAMSSPGMFFRGLVEKSIQFFSTRELPRTYDIYTVAAFSRLLSLLTWKIWRFGFPFGVLLPLSLYGLFVNRTRFPASYWFFITLYPAAVIMVFSVSRLRAPIIPVLSVAAAAGTIDFVRTLTGRQAKKALIAFCAMLIIAVGASVYGPFITENYDYAAEMYTCAGYQLSLSGRPEAAVNDLETALVISPGFLPAHRILGCVLHEQGRNDEALYHFEQVLLQEPDAYVIHYYMGVALLNHGMVEEGTEHLRKAAEGAKRSRDRLLLAQVRNILGAE